MMGIMDKVTCKPINEDEFLNETSFKNTTKKTTKDSVNGETMSYQQTDERHYKDDESISSSLSTTSSLSSIDICRNEFLSNDFKTIEHDMEKELEGIFLGNESNGRQAEEWYNSLDDEIRNEMEKGIQAIIYAGCMKAAKKIYDDYENPPKRRKIKR